MPVKICGITSHKDAQIAIKFGASALGFIFYRGSKRYVSPSSLYWLNNLSNNVKRVGVFVNAEINMVNSISEDLSLDYVQLHGNESSEYCSQICKPIIKAIHVNKDVGNLKVSDYKVFALLFDNYEKGSLGGTGKTFDWNLISSLNSSFPIILSGGLNSENIVSGIKIAHPNAVDVNSGVESSIGVKDPDKISKLFNVLSGINMKENIFINGGK